MVTESKLCYSKSSPCELFKNAISCRVCIFLWRVMKLQTFFRPTKTSFKLCYLSEIYRNLPTLTKKNILIENICQNENKFFFISDKTVCERFRMSFWCSNRFLMDNWVHGICLLVIHCDSLHFWAILFFSKTYSQNKKMVSESKLCYSKSSPCGLFKNDISCGVCIFLWRVMKLQSFFRLSKKSGKLCYLSEIYRNLPTLTKKIILIENICQNENNFFLISDKTVCERFHMSFWCSNRFLMDNWVHRICLLVIPCDSLHFWAIIFLQRHIRQI